MIKKYRSSRARQLFTRAAVAAIIGGVLALFLIMAMWGSGGDWHPMHSYFAGGVGVMAAASICCTVVAANMEGAAIAATAPAAPVAAPAPTVPLPPATPAAPIDGAELAAKLSRLRSLQQSAASPAELHSAAGAAEEPTPIIVTSPARPVETEPELEPVGGN